MEDSQSCQCSCYPVKGNATRVMMYSGEAYSQESEWIFSNSADKNKPKDQHIF